MGRFSVHHTLGAGSVANVLLWKRRGTSIVILISSTTFWYLFERAGYNLLSFISNVMLLFTIILFLWAKSASLLNRPLPPLPELEIPEEFFVRIAAVMRIWINQALFIAKEIAVHRNLKMFVQVIFILWLSSLIGSFFDFLTLFYLSVLLCLSVPLMYDKYQDRIDDKLIAAMNIARAQYRKIDDMVLSKIPQSLSKDKKTQ
ncbi:membrane traffic protein [Lithospermum erythrorhizon]|uniref:Reticulon-like protein n=1 Tax=Lithospermum erythrorhizon TaxID=34254 RepID=A0AAV3RDW7_LITER